MASLNQGTGTPWRSQASAASTEAPPPDPISATRGPGSGASRCNATAMSSASSTLPTLISPLCRLTAAQTSADPARLPVWLLAARRPDSVRPPFTTTSGLRTAGAQCTPAEAVDATRFAARRKRAPSVTPSMYASTRSVAPSSAKKSRKSDSVRSLALP